jgi:NAD(P)H dehydrogenase (quinone)
MQVLTIYTHPDRRSFCHGVLERFTAGLHDGGHTSEVVDLYAIKFDPVSRSRDVASYIDRKLPEDLLERAGLRRHVLDSWRWPGQRWLVERAVRGKSQADIADDGHHPVAAGPPPRPAGKGGRGRACGHPSGCDPAWPDAAPAPW